MTKATLSIRALCTGTVNGQIVLDTVATQTGCTVFFARMADSKISIKAVGGNETGSVDGAPIIACADLPSGLIVAPEEAEVMTGRNVAIATRNGEPVETVIDWLTFHYDYFGMNGAVIFNRAPQGQDDVFLRELAAALAKTKRPLEVVVMESALPLGAPDRPPEQHPFCVNEAPGHDRMDVPPADPWRSPLGQISIYEIARARFLRQARAVANLDICDVLYDPAIQAGPQGIRNITKNPFDMAAAAPGHVIQLNGLHCYPWRVRNGEAPGFGDHICVQFDQPRVRTRWCVNPAGLTQNSLLKFIRISNAKVSASAPFFRCMSIRHPVRQSSKIVPKTSLVEAPELIEVSENVFDFKPIRAPIEEIPVDDPDAIRTAIVTTMKNEGPFILEWIAYHQSIGVRDFLIYTNDCDDGTDTMFDLLQAKGIVQHRQNPFREMDLKPQHAALRAAEDEKMIQEADWLICMDVDEFIDIKVGDGHLRDLYAAVGDANLISCTWRLFGNSDLDHFEDDYTIRMHVSCAHEHTPKPHQAWGFKTLFRNNGLFKKFGVHRPKGLRPQLWKEIRWVNGSGQRLPKSEFRSAWRSTTETYGYDMVSLNHYAVRNAASFLVKRDRGRVNHVDRDQGEAYWFRMNNNATQDTSIQRHIPAMETKLNALMADPEIAEQHRLCVASHQAKIDRLMASTAQKEFYNFLVGERMKKLSKMHQYFGANVFLTGPQCVPDDVIEADHPEGFQFTVKRTDTQH